MSELEIIGIPFSNYVRSVRMLCEEKGAAYTLNPARPHAPEVTAIHPAGQVPCMRHGDVALFESQAIATYIDMEFPGPRFIPTDAAGAARVVQWISHVNVKVDRWIMREFVVPSVFFNKEKGPDTQRIEAALPEIDKCLAALDKGVASTGYLAGSALSFADMNVLPMLVTLDQYPRGKELIAKYRNLGAYIEKLSARPSFTNTAPPPRR
ncbi:MAG TPA: glutathione S-transferase family protein [Hyphomicrobiaceae bacterium]|nr:glutathione S-transferase family protein [Hyphomicrobiaceae bacterium]